MASSRVPGRSKISTTVFPVKIFTTPLISIRRSNDANAHFSRSNLRMFPFVLLCSLVNSSHPSVSSTRSAILFPL